MLVRRPAILFVFTALFVLGFTKVSFADGFKADNFQDDNAGWNIIVEVTADDDGDGAPCDEEGPGDRDGDGILNCDDYDPTGYLYDIDTGRILPGGSVSVSGCINILLEDGSQGFYQFNSSVLGTCTITVTAPPGYAAATVSCPNLDPPPFDVPSGGATVVLGNTEFGNTGFLSAPGCTPYYYTISYNSIDDVDVLANNFPFRLLPTAAPAPAASTWGLVGLVVLLLMAGTWRVALPRRAKQSS